MGESPANYMINCWRQPDSPVAAKRTKTPSSTPRAKPKSDHMIGKLSHHCWNHSGWEGLKGPVIVSSLYIRNPCIETTECNFQQLVPLPAIPVENAPHLEYSISTKITSWKRHMKHSEDRGILKSVALNGQITAKHSRDFLSSEDLCLVSWHYPCLGVSTKKCQHQPECMILFLYLQKGRIRVRICLSMQMLGDVKGQNQSDFSL